MTKDRRFWIGMAIVVAVAVAVRVTYIWMARRGLPVGGDSRYYHEGANLLAVDPHKARRARAAIAALRAFESQPFFKPRFFVHDDFRL